MGGRGNRYFQINCALAVARLNNINHVVLLINRNEPNLVLENLGLSLENLHKMGFEIQVRKICYIRDRVLNKLTNAAIRNGLNNSKSNERTYKALVVLLKYICLMIWQEPTEIFVPRDLGLCDLPTASKSIYMAGYFQSFHYGHYLQYAFLKPENLNKKNEKRVLIHVRRSDYRQNPNFGILKQEYYFRILDSIIMESEITGIDVFSDEVLDYEFVEKLTKYQKKDRINLYPKTLFDEAYTFSLMTQGYGFYVLANSSFSFWAAIFGAENFSKIFAPTPWFLYQQSPRMLYKPSWNLVQSEFYDLGDSW
jgi:hypothetical protein